MAYTDLINLLTVDCKDDGEKFTTTDRIQVIQSLLKESSYQLVYQVNTSFVYAKLDFLSQPYQVLVSSHIDCVYKTCFVSDVDADHWRGTFDNSATNAAIIDLMLSNKLSPSVAVAFTGDEEIDSRGAKEVMHYLHSKNIRIRGALVLDVSNEGYEDEAVCSIENDRGFDILTGYNLIQIIQKSGLPCVFLHDAEPDETWEYGKGIPNLYPSIPCLSLCLPVEGDLHAEEGVLLRKSSVDGFKQILVDLANSSL